VSETHEAVLAHLETVASEVRRRDADTLLELMARITGEEPRMWGPSIIGFGSYHYKYASGREGDAPAAGFSPRKAATSVYLPDGIGTYAKQLAHLGEHKTGVGCLYLKDLAKIDLEVLESIITESYRAVTAGTFGQRAADSQTERRE
jgi:hypothetical protein